MTVFKSKIENALGTFFIISLFYGFCFWVLSTLVPEIRALFPDWKFLLIFYLIIGYVYAGMTNNDLMVHDNRLEIINHLPLFKKRLEIPFDQIEAVKFKSEWTEIFEKMTPRLGLQLFLIQFAGLFFPFDYKWIKISGKKSYTVYCFGLERDYYSNKGPLFEDLFDNLAKKGLNVSWTESSRFSK